MMKMMKAPRTGSIRTLQLQGIDAWDAGGKSVHGQALAAASGKQVRVIQPHGCPRNGTMGHCYVEVADTREFIGLVLISSLAPAGAR
jgi:regulator of RNase E activity RraA